MSYGLISRFQVYNLSQNVQEDDLQHLQVSLSLADCFQDTWVNSPGDVTQRLFVSIKLAKLTREYKAV